MKLRVCIVASLISACAMVPLWGQASSMELREPVVERQEIEVTLSPENHLLSGASTVTLSPGAAMIEFALAPSATIDRLTVAGKGAPFSFAKGVLAVDLSRTGGDGTVTVEIAYHASFNDQIPEHPVNAEEPTFGVAGAITLQGVFLDSGAGWYPVPPVLPRHRLIRIAAPAGTEGVTAGRRIARETAHGVSRSTWEEDRPVENLSLSAGPYRIGERREAGVDIYTYFYPDNAALASRYLDASAKYLRFYRELLGPYPYQKIAVVENFFPTGYGFPSYTLLGGGILRLPFIVDTSLPHEIAHNWWGNGVLVDPRDGNWSEGLVTYLADYLLKEKKSPVAGREYRLQLLTDYAALVTPERDFPLRDFSGRVDPASRAIGYGKGAMLFHMVRSMIGDPAFFGALRDVCREKMYGRATWDDFGRAFSRRAGQDLASLMEQWLTRPGGPRLALAEVTRRYEGGEWVVSGAVIQSPPFYRLQLPLRLETSGSPVQQTLTVSRERTPFGFAVAVPPRRLLLDPEAEVFRLLSPAELPPTVNRLKGAEQLLVVLTETCRAKPETLQLLLKSLGQQGAQVVAEDRLDPPTIRERDLMYCGVPQQQGVFPSLPPGITFTPHEFAVDGVGYHDPGDLLFLVMRHPLAGKRIAAIFLPLSEEAAGQAAPKITHYGNYGYLVFAAGENRRKGMFPFATEGNAVEFGGGGGP